MDGALRVDHATLVGELDVAADKGLTSDSGFVNFNAEYILNELHT